MKTLMSDTLRRFRLFVGFCRHYIGGQARCALRHYRALAGRVPEEHRWEFAVYRHLTEQLRQQSDPQGSPFYFFHVYSEVMQMARQHGHEPRRVLELGPGASLGVLFCFVAVGAERAVGVDVEPVQHNPEFYSVLKDYLASVGGFRWWRPRAVDGRRPAVRYPGCWETVDAQALLDRIEYRAPVYAHAPPFGDGEFDFVFSNAAMEHFDQPEKAVQEVCRVLAPGGITTHEIDLGHHKPGHPLQHLRWSREEYQRMTQKYGGGHGIEGILGGTWNGLPYCNRLLAADWRRIFVEAGLEVLRLEVVSEVDPATINPADFAEPYCRRSREELAPVAIRVVARRPDSAS